MNYHVVADQHAFHDNILRLGPGRPFETTADMRDAIRSTWNAKVGRDDMVYDLGDVFVGRVPDAVARDYVGSLNGHKALALGNHDLREVEPEWYLTVGFLDVGEVYWGGDSLYLGHIPVYTEADLLTDEFLNKPHPVKYARIFVEYNELLRNNGCTKLIHGHCHDVGPERPGHFNCAVDRCGWGPTRLTDAVSRIRGEIDWEGAASGKTLAAVEKELQRRRS